MDFAETQMATQFARNNQGLKIEKGQNRLSLERTESFARTLQLKLKSLNGESGDSYFDFEIASPTYDESGYHLPSLSPLESPPASDASGDSIYFDVPDGPDAEIEQGPPTQNDTEFELPHRIQRSSSLKSGKTPPETPGRKKIVRFADVLGLDLADVRTFLDEIPKVPTSAFRDLKDAMDSLTLGSSEPVVPIPKTKTLLPSFHQPVAMPDFFEKISEHKVLLENAYLTDDFTIKGTVRVKNIDFHKSVYIRYSYNEWKTFYDLQASYIQGSCDGFSDRFEFTLDVDPAQIPIGSRLSLAARFHCAGNQFWDSNSGRNYVFHCVPSSCQQNLNFYGSDMSPSRSWM